MTTANKEKEWGDTHTACDNRLKKEGANATCCKCDPHEGCGEVSEETRKKELPMIEDKIKQIFKFLEIADVSQWQGMNVFEAGDHDSLYGILKTAFEQVESTTSAKEIKFRNDTPYDTLTISFEGTLEDGTWVITDKNK